MPGLHVGSVVGNDGRYTIDRKLGEGGMSVVWLAYDVRLEKPWAIKEVKRTDDDSAYKVNVEAMKLEAGIMRNLDHPALPHIVDIIDDEDGLLVVMDYVPGRNLHEILQDRLAEGLGPFPQEVVTAWGVQLCDALDYLHQRNVIYRDMKPNNVILQEDESVKIIDFGIARELKEGQEYNTQALGTHGYAAEEVYERRASPVSDVYALGVTLFALVTGHQPTEYDISKPIPYIREIDPRLSDGLEYAIAKATQWHAEDRYQSCAEFAYDLQHPPTSEDRRAKKRIRLAFFALVIAGGVCLLLGGASLYASSRVRASSFGGLMSRAAMASTEEEGGGASEAERLYDEAIALMPGNIEPYHRLIGTQVSYDDTTTYVYRDDNVFTTSEASRWSQLFREHRDDIEGDPAFARLCYDAGMHYFIYYDYGDNELTRGSQAADWFKLAIESCDARAEAGQECTLTPKERSAASSYLTIGEFSRRLEQVVNEGRESEAYPQYWDSLEAAVADASGGTDGGVQADPIVQLRLYRVVFEAIHSPTYLAGFLRAGVTQGRIERLLGKVREHTEALRDEAMGSALAQDLYTIIIEGIPIVRANIESTYNNAGVRAGASLQNAASSSSAGEREVR